VSRPVDVLIEFLESEQARGKTHVFLDDEARDGMRELYIRARKPIAKPPSPAVEIASASRPITQTAKLVIDGSDKATKLESVRRQAASWAPAHALGSLRETLVFASGNVDAKIMMIGDAPGYHEEKDIQPFVGPAGQKLNDILKAMGISRDEIYISSLVKFRPAIPKQTTNNRKPNPEEIASCLPLMLAEIDIVQPELIIALGDIAAVGLLNLSGSLESMRGTWHQISNIPVRVTYHPSYLLQSSSNQVKRLLWEDMLAVMEKLGMTISEKQRGFFLPKA
jgi:DNA polymerase